jgi:hypothetical protein
MSKEYHVFTERNVTHEQAFVFEVERYKSTDNPDFINILELWIVTTQNGNEVKSRIKFDQMILTIGNRVGGNVSTEGMPTLVDIFKDILPNDKKYEIEIDLCKRDIDDTETTTDKLIKANEYSITLENSAGNIQHIVDNIIKNKKH